METQHNEIGRWYHVSKDAWYPSVTTMLSNTSDHTTLDEWKKRIGEEAAGKECNRAATFGTRMHEVCEKYLQTGEKIKADWFTDRLFFQIKPVIDAKIQKTIATEIALFSHQLQLAGTADLVCMIGGVLTILDFKTSKRKKHKDWITDYFIQLACYCWMYRETYGEEPRKAAILFAHGVDTQPHYVEFDPREYYGHMIKRINKFRNKING